MPFLAIAEEMTGTTYQIIQATVGAGGVSTTTLYQIQYILGTNSMQAMSGSVYGIKIGFYDILNTAPGVAIVSYNDSQSTEDVTPTLSWIYSDADNDIQARFQVQVARDNFATVVIDSGNIESSTVSYTTAALTAGLDYQWRVRVHDGSTWSGWVAANNGFGVASAEGVISDLAALTAPLGEAIGEGDWQDDNDPYFYWEVTSEDIDILGFSYGLDALPAENVLTQSTYYYFPEDNILDGAHTFYVMAKRSSGIWETPVSFDIWVDTNAPSIRNLIPAVTGVLASDTPEISALLFDAASGINPETIELRINQSRVIPTYDLATNTLTYVPIIPLSEGEISVSLSVEDVVGNYGFPLVWSFTIDTEGPAGTLVVNSGDEMTTTATVTLNLTAEDDTSNVSQMMVSNDGIFDTEVWESYTAMRRNWILPAINGTRSVYVQFKDEAGNISEVVSDDIKLVIIAADTYILSGPSGITQVGDAQFTFSASLDDCQFSYKFDNEEWSDWSVETSIQKSGLAEGNHYFMIRAAKDLDRDGLLQIDEVDPTPALRVWTISSTGLLKPSLKPERPIRRWEEQ